MPRHLFLALALLPFTGCSLLGLDGGDAREQVFWYTAYDADDAVVVTGTLRIEGIPDAVSEEPSRLRGRWSLEATAGGVGPQDGEGTLAGTLGATIEGPTFAIDLNPGHADDNVGLYGRIVDDGEGLDGTWQHVGFGGPVAAGRFEGVRVR